MQIITNNGGIVDVVNETDLEKGVDHMLKNLRDTGQGFLIDEDAFYAYVAIRTWDNPFTAAELKQLQGDIISTQKHMKGSIIGLLKKL